MLTFRHDFTLYTTQTVWGGFADKSEKRAGGGDWGFLIVTLWAPKRRGPLGSAYTKTF